MSTRWVDSTHGKSQATLVGTTELRVVDDPTGTRSSKKTTLTALVTFIKSAIGLAGSDIANTPAGNIAATTVQAALDELDSEKVAKAGDTMTGDLIVLPASGGALVRASADGFATFSGERFTNDANGPSNSFNKARGTRASPANVQQNDILGQFIFRGRGGSSGGPSGDGFFNSSQLRMRVIAATPSSSDMESRTELLLCASGSVSPSEVYRADHAAGFSMFGANPVIDQNRLHRMRVYTVATLPTVVAGARAAVSDSNASLTAGIGAVVAGGGANHVPVYADAGNWRIG